MIKLKIKGSAYIMVLTVSMLMMLLVSVSLYVTMVSRRTTARYEDITSLYDLAVAGNEKVLHLLSNTIAENKNDVFYATNGSRDEFINEIMPILINTLNTPPFMPELLKYRLDWSLTIDYVLESGTVQYIYNATTLVCVNTEDNKFNVITTINKYIEGEASFPVIVEASIIWPEIANCLDGYSLAMVELMRITNLQLLERGLSCP